MKVSHKMPSNMTYMITQHDTIINTIYNHDPLHPTREATKRFYMESSTAFQATIPMLWSKFSLPPVVTYATVPGVTVTPTASFPALDSDITGYSPGPSAAITA